MLLLFFKEVVNYRRIRCQTTIKWNDGNMNIPISITSKNCDNNCQKNCTLDNNVNLVGNQNGNTKILEKEINIKT